MVTKRTTVKLEDWQRANKYLRLYLREGKKEQAKGIARKMVEYLDKMGLLDNGSIVEDSRHSSSNTVCRTTYAASEKMI